MAIRNYIFAGILLCLLIMLRMISVKQYPGIRWQRILLQVTGIFLSVTLILAIILFPGLAGIQTTGPYDPRNVTIQMNDASRVETYRDDHRERKLSVTIYYPGDSRIPAKSSPLIVFSHGGISVKTSNTSLFTELASHGYVVASIDHTYQSLHTQIDGRTIWIDPDYMRDLNAEDSHQDIEHSLRLYQEWLTIRMGDIHFVIDSLIEETDELDKAYRTLINPEKIALSGHSLGGSAVLGVARQRTDINAVLVLEAPYLYDITGIDGNDFTWNTEPYNCAVMNVYSDSGYPLLFSDHKYVQNANHLAQNSVTAVHYIQGSNHFTLTDLVRTAPVVCRLLGGPYEKSGYATLQSLNVAALGFFEQHLRQE